MDSARIYWIYAEPNGKCRGPSGPNSEFDVVRGENVVVDGLRAHVGAIRNSVAVTVAVVRIVQFQAIVLKVQRRFGEDLELWCALLDLIAQANRVDNSLHKLVGRQRSVFVLSSQVSRSVTRSCKGVCFERIMLWF